MKTAIRLSHILFTMTALIVSVLFFTAVSFAGMPEIEGSDPSVNDAKIWHTVRMKPGDTYDVSKAKKNTTVFIRKAGTYRLQGKSSTCRVVIDPSSNDEITVKLANGLEMHCGIYSYAGSRTSPINITNGDGTVILMSEKAAEINLSGYLFAPAIRKDYVRSKLVFETEDPKVPGTITAKSSYNSKSAGIGSVYYMVGRYDPTGHIEIRSGNIIAIGGQGAAGIGGGCGGGATGITISGGDVYAKGYLSGAGIGAGKMESASHITISGGNVQAEVEGAFSAMESDTAAAAIGGGGGGGGDNSGNDGAYITISGGMVKAINKTGGGAAIGGGYDSDGRNITISGGYVYAESVTEKHSICTAAAIGGGGGDDFCGCCRNLKITGGRVYAFAHNKDKASRTNAPAIGGGYNRVKGRKNTISISGGTVYAEGYSHYEKGSHGSIGGGIGKSETVITGGSVFPDNGIDGSVTDADGHDVHMLNVSFDGIDQQGIGITDPEFGGEDYPYGMNDVFTLNILYAEPSHTGMFYPWVPDFDRMSLTEARLKGTPYCGDIPFNSKGGTLYPATLIKIKAADASLKDGSAYAPQGCTKLKELVLPEASKGYKITQLCVDNSQKTRVANADGTLLQGVADKDNYTDRDGRWIYHKTPSLTLRVVETPNRYKVQFTSIKPNGASTDMSGEMDDQEFRYDESKALSKNLFVLPGYSFDGWKDKDGNTYSDEEIVSNLTDRDGGVIQLFAQWKPQEYTVTLNPGDAGGLAVTKVMTFDQCDTLPAFAELNWHYDDHEFHGWTVHGQLGSFYADEADVWNLCTLNESEAKGWTFDAWWIPIGSITITAVEDGTCVSVLKQDEKFYVQSLETGAEPQELQVTEGPPGTYSVVRPAIGTGKFQLSMQSDDYVIPVEQQYFEYDGTNAVSRVLEYSTVTMETDTGITDAYLSRSGGMEQGTKLLHVPEGEPVNINAFAEEGYHFDGYSVIGIPPSGFVPAAADQTGLVVTGEAHFMAHAEPDVYHVRFDPNTQKSYEGEMEVQDMVYDQPQDLFANRFERTGAVFTGWNTEANGSGTSYGDGENVQNLTDEEDETVTLYAQWDLTDYDIEYDLDGGYLPQGKSNPSSYTVEDSFSLVRPEKTDHAFLGWAGTDISIFEKDVEVPEGSTGDRRYVAVWNLLRYTVRFDSNGGTEIAPQVVDIHGKAVKPEDPERKGYVFKGWYTDKSCTDKYDFSSEVTEDITLYAKWVQKAPQTFTITYDLAGGTLDGKEGKIKVKAKMGETITVMKAPVRKGYEFRYWKGSKYYPGDDYVVEEDHTLTAVWKKKRVNPITGDNSGILMWTVTLLTSGFAFSALILRRRHKRRG